SDEGTLRRADQRPGWARRLLDCVFETTKFESFVRALRSDIEANGNLCSQSVFAGGDRCWRGCQGARRGHRNRRRKARLFRDPNYVAEANTRRLCVDLRLAPG